MKKKFGMVAVEKGYITHRQLEEAVCLQIELEFHRGETMQVGEVLVKKGYLIEQQVDEVMKTLIEEEKKECTSAKNSKSYKFVDFVV